MTAVDSPITMEMMIAVVITAAAAMALIGDSQNTVDGANGTTDTGANDATNSAAHGASNAITFGRAFLGAADNALAMTRLRQTSQSKQNGGSEQQADVQTSRQLHGGNTGFVHLRSQGKQRPRPPMVGGYSTHRAAKWLRLGDELSAL